MEIEGKDFMTWLHDIRKANKRERAKIGISDKEWTKKARSEAEKLLGYPIEKLEDMNLKK